jgi:hypothetical protein
MRSLFFIITFVFIGTLSFSQKVATDKVPSYIKECLQRQFPQTLDIPVAWEREKGNYKASITIMDTPAFMVIDTLGKTVRIERRIHETYLPKKAKDQLKSLDPNYQVVSVMQITDNKAKVTYKTVAKITNYFTFDGNGALIEKK